MSRPTKATIDLGAIRSNFHTLRNLADPGLAVVAVVKADAYGHGAVPVARTLEDEGVDMLAVALVAEGVELRKAGIRSPILVLATIFADDVPVLLEYDLTPTVADAETGRRIDELAGRLGRTVHYHLKVDTGMNRLGARYDEAVDLARELAGREHLRLADVYTHFACADDPEHPSVRAQLDRFESVLAELDSAGLVPKHVHAANSPAAVALPESHYGMIRPGLALYGIYPSSVPGRVDLKPALRLTTEVARVNRVPAGEAVSYGQTWTARRDSRIGILPVGYGDGYPRSLSNRGQVIVGGQAAPVVGRVCMDATMVDLTDVEDAGVGTRVVLIEADNASGASAMEVARRAETIPYEILTCLTQRVPRVYT